MSATDNHSRLPITSVQATLRVCVSDVRNDYSTNYAKYFAYARLLTPSRAAAEDLVQQAFLNIIDALEKGHTIIGDTLSAYVKRTIRNISISHHRKNSTQPLLRIIDSDMPSAESEYTLTTDRNVVANAIASLSEMQRTIVVMHYFDGLKVREIAKELNISESAAKTHLQRARHSIEAVINSDKSFTTQNE